MKDSLGLLSNNGLKWFIIISFFVFWAVDLGRDMEWTTKG
jgi:hypothetical protein